MLQSIYDNIHWFAAIWVAGWFVAVLFCMRKKKCRDIDEQLDIVLFMTLWPLIVPSFASLISLAFLCVFMEYVASIGRKNTKRI